MRRKTSRPRAAVPSTTVSQGAIAPDADPTTEALLSATRSLFIAEGVKGLSVRRIAELAGCTTMAVYSRYGGKDGLLGALFDEGFDRLRDSQRRIDADATPREQIIALCGAYLATAIRYPEHYALMLGQHSGGFTPAATSVERANGAFDVLARAVERWLQVAQPGDSSPARARRIALRLLAMCHGWASLSLIGYVDADGSGEDELSSSVAAILDGAAA
jgi:AcrR family transcriptional regulator